MLLSGGRRMCEHCRHSVPLPSGPGRVFLKDLPWIWDGGSELFSRLSSPLAWEFIWAKGSCCCWNLDHTFTSTAVPGRLCLFVTQQLFCSSSSWLLLKLFPMFLITTLVLVTASQLDFHMPAEELIFCLREKSLLQ